MLNEIFRSFFKYKSSILGLHSWVSCKRKKLHLLGRIGHKNVTLGENVTLEILVPIFSTCGYILKCSFAQVIIQKSIPRPLQKFSNVKPNREK